MAADPASSSGAEEVLDLTNSHLHNLTGVELSAALKTLDLTANRLKDLDPRILALTGLRTLNLRQNLLTNVSAWAECSCKGTVEDLEFRDNQIKEIPRMEGFTALRRLEFSYNEIRSIAPLESLNAPALDELYVACNKVTGIVGLSQLTTLRVLELGSNRLRTVENLDALTGLQELWLGRNRITKIENMSALVNLRKISVQSNRLESMLGLEACTALEELYLSHNGIWKLEGLSTLSNLKMLDVSSNRIAKVEGLQALSQLEDLWLNDNRVANLDAELEEALAPVKASLTTIYLENNPVAKQPDYKARVKGMLPNLKQLDANFV